MVLQRDQSDSGMGLGRSRREKITVQFNQQKKEVKADKNGKWISQARCRTGRWPYQLIVTGKNIRCHLTMC